jgi:predicted dehydrogenase
MSDKKLKVGIIGANWSLKVHGTAWRMLPNIEVAAVCTAHQETAEAAAKAFGIPKAYWNVEEMAADPDIDIIDVGSRPAYRYDMVMAALKGGKHVYDALPFAIDAQKAKEMRDLQQGKGLVGVVDAQFRWVPAALHMKELIDQSFIGKPLGFNVQLLMPLRSYDDKLFPYCAWPEGGIAPYLWLADKQSGGGGWRNFGSHTVLFLTHLLGEVEEAVGTVDTGVKHWTLPDGSSLTPDTEDLGCAVLQMKNGAIGNIQTGWSVPDSACLRVEVWGDKGRLLYEDPSFGDGISARLYAGDGRLAEYPKTAGGWLEIPARHYEVPGLGFSKENAPPYMVSMGWMFHDMVRTIREGGAGSPNFAEACHAQRVVEAVVQSKQTRRWTRIDEGV